MKESAGSSVGLAGVLEPLRELGDVDQLAAGPGDDEVVGHIVGHRQPAAVQAVEGDDGGQPQPLVAVDEGVVPHDGVQQCGGLVVQRGIGVGTERRGTRTSRAGLQKSDVADLDRRTGGPFRDVQQILDVEEDHLPSRANASAYRGSSPSSTESSSSRLLVRSM